LPQDKAKDLIQINPKQFITYKNKALFEHSLDKAISSKLFKKII
jgi:2-C-methyl-D-erythritol 4-phosphate cytidylyltransferase/2-C-methyl-D-erythritol 2,4-cyclodiphosphate synthase